jgi:hypothetical protein
VTIALKDSLGSARAYVIGNRAEGVVCPCCDQFAKVYKRKINKNHIATMVEVWKIQRENIIRDGGNQNDWVYLPNIAQKSRDFATAQYFGLIEQKPGERDDGAKQTGWWRITSEGLRFLRDALPLRTYAHIYNGVVTGYSGRMTSVDKIYKGFNYNELMGA